MRMTKAYSYRFVGESHDGYVGQLHSTSFDGKVSLFISGPVLLYSGLGDLGSWCNQSFGV